MKKLRIDFVDGELEYLERKTPNVLKQYLRAIANGHEIDFDILLYAYNIGVETGKKEALQELFGGRREVDVSHFHS